MAFHLIQTLDGHTGSIWSAAWSPSGEILATAGQDRTIRIWKLDQTWRCVETLDGTHSKTIRQLQFNKSGDLLASASFDATIVIWKKKEFEFEAALTLEGHESEVKSISWSFDDRFLATCSRDKTVWIWETDIDFEYETAAVLARHTQDVKVVAFSNSSYFLASGSYDNTICVWNEFEEEWACVDVLYGHEGTVWSLQWVENCLVSSSDDLTIRYWEFKDNKFSMLATLSGFHTRSIYSIDSVEEKPYLISASGDDKISLIEKSTRTVLVTEKVHEMDVNSAKINPVYNLIATVSDDETIKIWNIS